MSSPESHSPNLTLQIPTHQDEASGSVHLADGPPSLARRPSTASRVFRGLSSRPSTGVFRRLSEAITPPWLRDHVSAAFNSSGGSPPSATSSLEDLPRLAAIVAQRMDVSPVVAGGMRSKVPDTPIIYVPFSPTSTQRGGGGGGVTASAATPAAVLKSAAKSHARSTLGKSRRPPNAFTDDDDDHAAANGEEPEADHCSICLEAVNTLQEGERVAVTACGHAYHVSCWLGWAERQNRSCPLCRTRLALEDCIGLSPLAPTPPPLLPAAAASSGGSGAANARTPRTPEEAAATAAAEEEAATENAPPSRANALAALPYRELQQRAKAAGIKANQKAAVLVQELAARA